MELIVPSTPETLAAVEVLARAGVSDEAVGRVIREWLLRGKPAPAASDVAPAQPTRADWVRPSPEISSALPPAVTPVQVQAPPSLAPRKFEFVKVRFADGSATNVAIPIALFQRAVRVLGDEKAVRNHARILAKEVPAGTDNRSGWVASRLTQELAGRA